MCATPYVKVNQHGHVRHSDRVSRAVTLIAILQLKASARAHCKTMNKDNCDLQLTVDPRHTVECDSLTDGSAEILR